MFTTRWPVWPSGTGLLAVALLPKRLSFGRQTGRLSAVADDSVEEDCVKFKSPDFEASKIAPPEELSHGLTDLRIFRSSECHVESFFFCARWLPLVVQEASFQLMEDETKRLDVLLSELWPLQQLAQKPVLCVCRKFLWHICTEYTCHVHHCQTKDPS